MCLKPILIPGLKMNNTMKEELNLCQQILEEYKQGKRYFEYLDLDDDSDGNFEGQDLEGIIFENCSFYISFKGANLKNAKFINGGIKTCDFREADLSNAHFENLAVEGSQFAGSKHDGIYFNNNSAYGQHVSQADFDTWIKNTNDERLT